MTTTKTSSAISQPLLSPIVQSLSHISTDYLSTSQSESTIKSVEVCEGRLKNKYYEEKNTGMFYLVCLWFKTFKIFKKACILYVFTEI